LCGKELDKSKSQIADLVIKIGAYSNNVVPAFELGTKHLRQILPESIGLDDVVFNILRVAILTVSFCNGKDTLNVQKAKVKRWKKRENFSKVAYTGF
jgi:homoserine kinase